MQGRNLPQRISKKNAKRIGSFDVSGSVTSRNERTGQSDMENVAYNFTLSYGTCESFRSVYSFSINV